jgi:hypothetical protein
MRPELEFSLCCCRSSIFTRGLVRLQCRCRMLHREYDVGSWDAGCCRKPGGRLHLTSLMTLCYCSQGRHGKINVLQPRKSLSFSRPRAPLRLNQILLAACPFPPAVRRPKICTWRGHCAMRPGIESNPILRRRHPIPSPSPPAKLSLDVSNVQLIATLNSQKAIRGQLSSQGEDRYCTGPVLYFLSVAHYVPIDR